MLPKQMLNQLQPTRGAIEQALLCCLNKYPTIQLEHFDATWTFFLRDICDCFRGVAKKFE